MQSTSSNEAFLINEYDSILINHFVKLQLCDNPTHRTVGVVVEDLQDIIVD
jgi:hypothetical protein